MSRIDRLRKQNQEIFEDAKGHLQELDKMGTEAGRVADVARDVHIIVSDLDRQFEKATGLNWSDVKFLFLAVGLQCIRQYVLTKFPERLPDKEAAEKAHREQDKIFSKLYGYESGEEHSNRHHRYYNPSLDEIITNPVPFDASMGADGALKGGGHMRHRVTAIGHDPLLGYVFGTANIATSTLTNHKFQSFHIVTGERGDAFGNHASTPLVLLRTREKLLDEEWEGKQKVSAALIKEAFHLKSDIGTKFSLPIPIVPIVNAQFASELAKRGLDMANIATIGKQAAYAVMINTLIGMLHELCYDESISGRKLYSVKTRKILMYSNTIATVSNVIVTALFAYAGSKEAIKNFDLGGFAVTLYRIVTDRKYIKEIKQEFLANEFYNIVMG